MKRKTLRDVSLLKRILVVLAIIVIDLIVFIASYLLTSPIYNREVIISNVYIFDFILCSIMPIILLLVFGAYNFKNLKNFLRLIYLSAISLTLAFIINLCLNLIVYKMPNLRYIVLFYLISFVSLISLRLVYFFIYNYVVRYYRKNKALNPTLIIGAGFTGRMLNNELYNYGTDLVPVCFVDDDEEKISTTVQGLKVYGPTLLIPEICKKMNIKTIVFAIPSCDVENRERILKYCKDTECDIRVIPSADNLLRTQTYISQISKIDINKLIDRYSFDINNEIIYDLFKDKSILVTGGGGSIGSEICRQISYQKFNKLVILDSYENSAYEIYNELKTHKKAENIFVEIVSCRDYDKLKEIFLKYNFDIVIHSAAHKHVPLMEHNPEEAVKNNCTATKYVAELCDEFSVQKMLLISTDKAIAPTSVMGATKRAAELIIEAVSKKSKCKFVSVRFGNVLGSNGSVIQLFLKQIENGGPVTVTHPEILRYFMTIPDAVHLVLKAGAIAKQSGIYYLDMGKPVKILNLAENLIKMCGFIPYKEIDIEFSGLRPGEKLEEELQIDTDLKSTIDDKISYKNFDDINLREVKKQIKDIINTAENNNSLEVIKALKALVPNYKLSDYYEELLKNTKA